MTHDSLHIPAFSSNALYVFGYLQRHGGSMRICPLLRRSGIDCEALIAAIKELHERRWVNVEWRRARSHLPPDLPERFREVERITTTRFGRHRFPATWSTL
jgi:hypothetical protein